MFSNWFRFLKRSPRAGDGKETTMSQPNESPGARAPVDANPPTPPPASAPAPADVSRHIAELTNAVNQLLAAQRQQPAAAHAPSPSHSVTGEARDRYVREHLADLPEAYRRQMPEAADERQLAEAEQAIRRQFRGDLRAALGAGGAAHDASVNVGGEIQGGRGPAAAAAAVEHGRLSGVQQIALGLRDAKPVGPAHPEVVHAPARHDAAPATAHATETVPSGAD